MSTTTPINVRKDPKKKARVDLLAALTCFGLALVCTLIAALLDWAGLYYFALPVLALCTVGCNRLASWGLLLNRMAGEGKRQRPFAFIFHLLLWLCFLPGLLLTAFLDYPLARAYKQELRAQLEPAVAYVKSYTREHGRGPAPAELAQRFPGQALGIRYCPDGGLLVYLEHYPVKEIHKFLNVDLKDNIWANLDAADIALYRRRQRKPASIKRWLECSLDGPKQPSHAKEQP